MKISTLGKIAIVLSILIFPMVFFLILSKGKNNYKHLDFFGPKEVNVSGDTAYFTVPDFRLINQNGDTISQKSLEGKIYVANFFFASCQGVCHKMPDAVNLVQDEFKMSIDALFHAHSDTQAHVSCPALEYSATQ